MLVVFSSTFVADAKIISRHDLVAPLNTDIVASDIPLLLSRKSMKKAIMTLDNAIVFGDSKLITTKSGHYPIPISLYKTVFNNLTTRININITLITTQTNQNMT